MDECEVALTLLVLVLVFGGGRVRKRLQEC